MGKINNLRLLIEKQEYPKVFPEWGGANLIITKDLKRDHLDHDILVYSKNASALSWLVTKLSEIYELEINYINKYSFYPSIGENLIKSISKKESLFDTMIYVVDEIEKKWGEK